MSAKKERFKYFNIHYVFLAIKNIISHIKTIHENLMQPDKETQLIPYLVWYQWIVDILAYGIVLTLVYINLFIITGWLKYVMFIFSLGAIRWLWLDLVENTTQAIKGNK